MESKPMPGRHKAHPYVRVTQTRPPGVMEIAIRYRTDAWRVVYVTEVARRLWVLHAFRKKSKTGIRTPKADIDLAMCFGTSAIPMRT